MNETTPGPWNTDGTVIWGAHAGTAAVAATRFPILTCHHCKAATPLQLKMASGGTLAPVKNDHEARANAVLIAAAPELLAFCRSLRAAFYEGLEDDRQRLEDQDEKTRYLVGELEAVIARAEGRR